jgi:hypothetical protein
MKLSQLPIFLRYRHTLQVLMVSNRLEVPAYQKEIDVVLVLLL